MSLHNVIILDYLSFDKYIFSYSITESKSGMGKHKSSFHYYWPLVDSQNCKWLETVLDDKFKARCKVCPKFFQIDKQGSSALDSHAKGKKHKQSGIGDYG